MGLCRRDVRLRGSALQENSSELEAQVEAQVRSLALALEERRASLLDFVRADRDVRLRALKEQVGVPSQGRYASLAAPPPLEMRFCCPDSPSGLRRCHD